MDIIESIDYKGAVINVYPDIDSISPRGWDNLGIMEINSHRDYNLPSEGGGLQDEADGEEEEALDLSPLEYARLHLENEGAICILPIIGYDHGGLSISVSASFNKWDGGQLGFIYTTAKQAKKIGVNTTNLKGIERILRAEVELYNQYLTGDVYSVIAEDKEGNVIDSISGFFGREAINEGVGEMKSKIDTWLEEQGKSKKKLLEDITPLIDRIQSRLNLVTGEDAQELKKAIERNAKSIRALISKNL